MLYELSEALAPEIHQVFESHAAAAHAGDRASVKVGCPLCKRPVKWDGIFRAASAAQATPWQLGGAVPDVDPDDPGIADVRSLLQFAIRCVSKGRCTTIRCD